MQTLGHVQISTRDQGLIDSREQASHRGKRNQQPGEVRGILEVDNRGEEASMDMTLARLVFGKFNLLVNFDAALFCKLHGVPLAHSAGTACRVLTSIVCGDRQLSAAQGALMPGIVSGVLNLQLSINVALHRIIVMDVIRHAGGDKMQLAGTTSAGKRCRQVGNKLNGRGRNTKGS